MSGNRFGDDEQRDRPQHHRPTGVDGRGKEDWKESRDEGPDEGHEPHETCEKSPQHGIGHADDRKTHRNNNAVQTPTGGCINANLSEVSDAGIQFEVEDREKATHEGRQDTAECTHCGG